MQTALQLLSMWLKERMIQNQSEHTITAYHLPEGVSYQVLHDRLKQQGYVIYAGQGNLENKIFRVANMGALSEAEFIGFLDAFEQACKPA